MKKEKARYDSLKDVIKAKSFLEQSHSELLQNADRTPRTFIYCGSSVYDKYTRYHFFLNDKKEITYIAISHEERERVINSFKEKEKKNAESYIYIDSAIGMISKSEVYHRFYSAEFKMFAYLSDQGKIKFLPSLEEIVD